MLGQLLGHWGYVTFEAGTTAEALERTAGARPDLVIVNLHQPDAAEDRHLIGLLRDRSEPPPIIALCPHGGAAVDETTAVLPKPFELGALLELVARHTRRA